MNHKFFLPLIVLGVVVTSVWGFQRTRTTKIEDQTHAGNTSGHTHDDAELVTFDRSVDTLDFASQTEIIDLSDGETYEMDIKPVTATIDDKKVRLLSYNGSVPGPILKVKQNSTIKLNVKNSSETDQLLHSHGLRLENAFDGTHLVQEPIQNGESFTYELTFPDPGVYWYHPHIREDYGQELGLYGNFWVVPEDEDYWAPVDREELLVLDDILLDDQGISPFRTDLATHTLMGRFGNTYLINGTDAYSLNVKQDEVIRLFLTNVANTRTFRFALEGVRLKLVGADISKYEQEEFVDYVDLAPSERAIVELVFDQAGEYTIWNDTPVKKSKLGVINVNNSIDDSIGNNAVLRENVDLSAEIDKVLSDWDSLPEKSLRLGIDMMMSDDRGDGMHGSMMVDDHTSDHGGAMMNPSSSDSIEWEDHMPEMNNSSTEQTLTWGLVDEETNKKNMDIDWEFTQGDLVKIKIYNDPNSMHPMQHPIHIHGQRFLVVTQDGKRIENMAWKDTYQIPTGSTVELLVEMSNPGKWMLHCHISEHLSSGMMLGFEVL